MRFHVDCWSTLHATVQSAYLERASAEGVPALVGPYSRTEMASWLPAAAIEEAVESLGEQLESTSFGSPVLTEEIRAEE